MKYRLSALIVAGALLPACGFRNGIGGPIVDITLASASGPIGSLIKLDGADFSLVDSFSIGGQPGIVLQKSTTSVIGFVMPGTTTGKISVTTSLGGLAVSSG